jgi:hypothetical protein
MIELGVVLLVQGNAAVSAIAPTGGYFAQLPKDYKLPSWTYQTVSDPADYVLSGPMTQAERRVQIDCYGATAADAILLANAIDALLSGFTGTLTDPDATHVQGIFRDNMLDFFDTDSRTPRRMLDYKIWFSTQ